MFKLLVILISFCSCHTSRPVRSAEVTVPPLEKSIVLTAYSQSAAGEAQSIIYLFCPPSQMQISDNGQGMLEMHFSFLIGFPHRYNQMMHQLMQVPGIIIQKEQ